MLLEKAERYEWAVKGKFLSVGLCEIETNFEVFLTEEMSLKGLSWLEDCHSLHVNEGPLKGGGMSISREKRR